MHFVKKKVEEKRIEFDNKLKSKKILRVPGAYNPLTAKVIEEIGYDGVYVSGGVMSNDLGYPDIGLTTLKDVSNRANQIARVTNLPTIVDIDTGFKSCKETIETFENFGITGIHIEDQVSQKRCGHLDNKELITKDEMIKKIKECVSSKKDKNFKKCQFFSKKLSKNCKKCSENFQKIRLFKAEVDKIDQFLINLSLVDTKEI